jgi:N-acetylglutamate synthase-like GNAT family acetyltransferase
MKVIRIATLDDASVLANVIRLSFRDVADRFALTQENCPKHPSNCETDWVQKHMNQGARYFILELNGIASGCVAMKPTGPNECDLERLAVLPQQRKCGFGRNLVDHVLKEAKHSGFSIVRIAIIAHFTELKNWYLKIGFIEGETKSFAHLPFKVMMMSYDPKQSC